MKGIKKIKILDVFIVIISLLLIGFSIVYLIINSEQGSKVRISTPETEFVYSLDKDAEITVESTLGESVIVINDGEAYFKSSPCDNQICVHSSPVHDTTGFIACIPNEVFLRIESNEKKKEEDFDSVGY